MDKFDAKLEGALYVVGVPAHLVATAPIYQVHTVGA
jgi:hypothetical protein